MRISMGLAALVGMASAASAQTPAPPPPPDPAAIVLPDMTPTRDPQTIKDGWKYFYFHKAGVSYPEAYSDFAECYRFLPVAGMPNLLPTFAPWSEPLLPQSQQAAGSYGLVGAAIGAMVVGALDRRSYQARLRRCLEPRGYVRYPLVKDRWERLIDGYSADSVARQALAAAGPTPDLPVVTR